MLQGANDKYKGYIIDFKNAISDGSQQGTVRNCSHKNFPNVQLCVKIIKNTQSIQNPEVREIQILTKLRQFNNPHLIKVFDIFEVDSEYFIIMELCQKGTLEKHIQQQKQPLSAPDILNFVTQFVDGYQVLHANDIFHRDIKPSNIFMGKKNSYIIGDLGSSRMISLDDLIQYTRNGTYPYMSPQMLEGNQFNAKTDMYSLGLIIFEMTHLRLPYKSQYDKIDNFINNLKVNPVNVIVKYQIKGSNEQIQEVQTLLNSLIVYDEKKRMGFEELFNRVFQLKVYQDFLKENNIILQNQYKVELQNINEQKQNNIVSNQNQKDSDDNPLTSFLKLVQKKFVIANYVSKYFEQMINEKLINISKFEYYYFKSALYGYIFYLYINMEAIYEVQPDKLNKHLQQGNVKNLIEEFKKQQTPSQNQQQDKCKQELIVLQQNWKNLSSRTIEIMNQDQNLSKNNNLIQYKQFIEIKDQQPDYRLFLKYTEQIYHQYIKQHCIKLIEKKPTDTSILFLANISILFQLEKQFCSVNLFTKQKVFPALITDIKVANDILKQNENSLLMNDNIN